MSATVKIVTNPNVSSSIKINISADELRIDVTLYIQKPLELLGLIDILGKTVKPKNISNIEYVGDIELSDKIKNKISKFLTNDEINVEDFIDFKETKSTKLDTGNFALRSLADNLSRNNCAPSLDSKKTKIINYVKNVLGPNYSEQEAYDLFVKAMGLIER